MSKHFSGRVGAGQFFGVMLLALTWGASAQAIVINETDFSGWSSQFVVDTTTPGPATSPPTTWATGAARTTSDSVPRR